MRHCQKTIRPNHQANTRFRLLNEIMRLVWPRNRFFFLQLHPLSNHARRTYRSAQNTSQDAQITTLPTPQLSPMGKDEPNLDEGFGIIQAIQVQRGDFRIKHFSRQSRVPHPNLLRSELWARARARGATCFGTKAFGTIFYFCVLLTRR